MKQGLNNNRLPFEVLKLIFDHFRFKSKRETLEIEYEWEKKELRQFLLVCKSWSLVIRKILLGLDVSSEIYDEYDMQPLLRDIPYFGHQVKSFLYLPCSKIPKQQNELAMEVWKVLLHCPNLISIEFCGHDIRVFLNLGVLTNHPDTRLLFLRAVHRYRSTIKVLYMDDLDILLGSSFFNYIADIPKLIELRVEGYHTESEFNVSRLLEAAPNLEDLQVSSLNIISSNHSKNESTTKPVTYSNLKSVYIGGKTIDADHLIYLIKQVKHSQRLHVYIDNVTGKTYSEKESKKLLFNLVKYTMGKKEYGIEYKFGQYACSFNTAKFPKMKKMSRRRIREEEEENEFLERMSCSLPYYKDEKFKYNLHHPEGSWNDPYLIGHVDDNEDLKI